MHLLHASVGVRRRQRRLSSPGFCAEHAEGDQRILRTNRCPCAGGSGAYQSGTPVGRPPAGGPPDIAGLLGAGMTAAGLQAILQQQSHRMPPEMVSLICTGYKCDMSASESEVSGNLCLHQSASVHQSACFRPVQGQTAGMAFMCCVHQLRFVPRLVDSKFIVNTSRGLQVTNESVVLPAAELFCGDARQHEGGGGQARPHHPTEPAANPAAGASLVAFLTFTCMNPLFRPFIPHIRSQPCRPALGSRAMHLFR